MKNTQWIFRSIQISLTVHERRTFSTIRLRGYLKSNKRHENIVWCFTTHSCSMQENIPANLCRVLQWHSFIFCRYFFSFSETEHTHTSKHKSFQQKILQSHYNHLLSTYWVHDKGRQWSLRDIVRLFIAARLRRRTMNHTSPKIRWTPQFNVSWCLWKCLIIGVRTYTKRSWWSSRGGAENA